MFYLIFFLYGWQNLTDFLIRSTEFTSTISVCPKYQKHIFKSSEFQKFIKIFFNLKYYSNFFKWFFQSQQRVKLFGSQIYRQSKDKCVESGLPRNIVYHFARHKRAYRLSISKTLSFHCQAFRTWLARSSQ